MAFLSSSSAQAKRGREKIRSRLGGSLRHLWAMPKFYCHLEQQFECLVIKNGSSRIDIWDVLRYLWSSQSQKTGRCYQLLNLFEANTAICSWPTAASRAEGSIWPDDVTSTTSASKNTRIFLCLALLKVIVGFIFHFFVGFSIKSQWKSGFLIHLTSSYFDLLV